MNSYLLNIYSLDILKIFLYSEEPKGMAEIEYFPCLILAYSQNSKPLAYRQDSHSENSLGLYP